jgi:hypothetical protein
MLVDNAMKFRSVSSERVPLLTYTRRLLSP